MKLARALLLALLLPGLLGAGAIDARADDAGLSLSLVPLWGSQASTDEWTGYLVTVDNHRQGDFTGSVLLSPVPNQGRGIPTTGFPDYRQRITVPAGGSRSVPIYLVETQAGYAGSLLDASGRTVAGPVALAAQGTGYAVGILTDQPQGGERIETLRPMTGSQLHVTRFGGARPFPNAAVLLAGLDAVVVDDFDVTSLSEAQQRALKDFVGLGGRLVVTGGSRWRTTLQPLAERGLSPLKPLRTDETSLRPLLDLAGESGALSAPVAVGEAAPGTTVLAAPGGPALAAEQVVGAGRVLALAFDPLLEPVAGTRAETAAWTFAFDRSLSDVRLGATAFGKPAAAPGIKTQVFGQAPYGPNPEHVLSFLHDLPAAAVPPLGLLGLLLVVYVLLAGPLNYIVLRRAGRRGLAWATIPAIAALFTSAAYAAGLDLHGASYQDNDLQVLRVGPDGVLGASDYHGIFTPHRGDFEVDLPAGTLGSTALTPFQGGAGGESAVIDIGGRERVHLSGSALGSLRLLQTISVSHALAVPLEAHLKIAGGRVTGSIHNGGDRALSGLELVGGSGQLSRLEPGIVAAHGTVEVSGQLGRAAPFTGAPFATGPNRSGPTRSDIASRILEDLAWDGRDGGWTLAGATSPLPSLTVAGSSTTHSGTAIVLQPVALEGADTIAAAGEARMVAGDNAAGGYRKLVWDLALPPGYRGPVQLSYSTGGPEAFVQAVEVYDWDTAGWRALAITSGPGQVTLAATPTAGELRTGIVRVRIAAAGDRAARPSLKGTGTGQ